MGILVLGFFRGRIHDTFVRLLHIVLYRSISMYTRGAPEFTPFAPWF